MKIRVLHTTPEDTSRLLTILNEKEESDVATWERIWINRRHRLSNYIDRARAELSWGRKSLDVLSVSVLLCGTFTIHNTDSIFSFFFIHWRNKFNESNRSRPQHADTSEANTLHSIICVKMCYLTKLFRNVHKGTPLYTGWVKSMQTQSLINV